MFQNTGRPSILICPNVESRLSKVGAECCQHSLAPRLEMVQFSQFQRHMLCVNL